MRIAGLALLSSRLTYLGGAGKDGCDGVALDRSGDIDLACHSDSPDFAGAAVCAMDAVVLQIDSRARKLIWAARTRGSDWDAAGAMPFPAKLGASDLGRVSGAFLGGTKLDGASGVAVNAAGNPIVSGGRHRRISPPWQADLSPIGADRWMPS